MSLGEELADKVRAIAVTHAAAIAQDPKDVDAEAYFRVAVKELNIGSAPILGVLLDAYTEALMAELTRLSAGKNGRV